MEIRPALISILTPTSSGSESRQPLAPLQAGQRLEAWVLGRHSSTQVLLDLGGRHLVADSNLPLRTGDHLKLEVIHSNGPQPHLKILSQTSPRDQLTTQTLRTALPKQEPLPQALRSMATLVSSPDTSNRLPSPVLDKLMSLLDSLPNRIDLVQAATLKTALRHSGLLHESLQTSPSAPSSSHSEPQDLKSKLLQLAKAIRNQKIGAEPPASSLQPLRPSIRATIPLEVRPPSPQSHAPSPPLPTPSSPAPPSARPPTVDAPDPGVSPTPAKVAFSGDPEATSNQTLFHQQTSNVPDQHRQENAQAQDSGRLLDDPIELLTKKVSGAIARIVLDQLASLPKMDSPSFTWHFELPFKNGEGIDLLHLTIQGEQHSAKRTVQNPSWSVVVEMEPPDLGKIQVRLVLQDEQVSAYFWSESDRTHQLFERHLDKLAQNFRSQGLQPNLLQTLDGTPPASPQPAPDRPLVDESI